MPETADEYHSTGFSTATSEHLSGETLKARKLPRATPLEQERSTLGPSIYVAKDSLQFSHFEDLFQWSDARSRHQLSSSSFFLVFTSGSWRSKQLPMEYGVVGVIAGHTTDQRKIVSAVFASSGRSSSAPRFGLLLKPERCPSTRISLKNNMETPRSEYKASSLFA